ncbi:hypothetical protein AXI59_07120 [Bacillus nakamurai]|uniref:DUF421 domain-containing protein n=1 Tax=Bacillus nakamurai TaxID=1793963 RepID=A0A150F6N2_9BACI|nr:DUF421 domain-containing protein [Bacillus nakamurai]KXZ18832.1 hypothetical protein AXI58_15890 [Bacillus nakamurai]KXZ24075.1 hypothetical protein AXI59_07120 [Bacillus nakamurai]MCP6683523.1 DUF421 domain-containing protein [Bacillus nakamurai]MED1226053.1 DUF421 domain-containing protein [Bacillus nakamurai]
MSEYPEVIIRTALSFSILFIGARLLGKQTISQMTLFDFIAAISLGAITANLSFNTKLPIHYTVIAYTIFVTIIYGVAYFSMKNRAVRGFFAGKPTIVIQNGKILENNMKTMRYTIDYLNQQLREKDIFDVSQVQTAIIETNGGMSVEKKPEYAAVTRQDLGISAEQKKNFAVELVMDGELVTKNLKENHVSETWLRKELDKRQLKVSDVVYAVRGSNGRLFIDTYDDHITSPVDQE